VGQAVRKKALYALRELGPTVEGALAAVREALDDPEEDVREWATQALIQLLQPSGEGPQVVRKKVRHADPEVRHLGLLWMVGTGFKLPELLAVLGAEISDRDPKRRRDALSALSGVSPPNRATAGVPAAGTGRPGQQCPF
jgi:HEAT repeat protein